MIRERLRILIQKALHNLNIDEDVVEIERPEDNLHGDYATNIALLNAKKSGLAPLELANKIVAELLREQSNDIAKIEIAGPGFINFFIENTIIEREVFQKEFLPTRKGEKINIEFISTNPTGELHIGHGRTAFYGDTLSRVLVLSGADVSREFYINDSRESNQINELGKTALGKGEQYKTPELGEKMKRLDFSGLSEEEAGGLLASAVQESNRAFIENILGIHFDIWYSEEMKLRVSGANSAMLQFLKDHGNTYEKDGALWLKTTEYGDDEDRVIVRGDGTMTYFIADIAYHQNKFERGFTTVIDILGADHHGHMKRMHAVGKILGWPKAPLSGVPQPIVFIAQLVSLKEDGVSKKMSKRAGNVILLRDLVDEFGIDVARWFFIEKALTTQMNFDMALARDTSDKNPVYYVQYAHARLASIQEKTNGLQQSVNTLSFDEMMRIPSARALALSIIEFPEIVSDVSRNYMVNALTNYATDLAQCVNSYYHNMRVIEDNMYDASALALFLEAKATLSRALNLLGISAPERM